MNESNTGASLEILRKYFKEYGNKVRFNVGQCLTESKALPGNLLLLEKGIARLLGTNKDRKTTICKLAPPSLVGVASVLRGSPCEEVRASTEILAWSITDQQFISFYKNQDQEISSILSSNIWEAELYSLFESIKYRSAREFKSFKTCFDVFVNGAFIVQPDSSSVKNAISNNNVVYVASKQNDNQIGYEITFATDLDSINETEQGFPPRLIAFPKENFNQIYVSSINWSIEDQSLNNDPLNNPIPLAPLNPPVSSLNNSFIEKDFLVKAEGPVQETLACFNMLCKYLSIPFRRDSIEKILRDCTRRKQPITLRLFAEIASSIGLHVSLAKLPANLGVRLQTPSLLSWGSSFALVTGSDQLGLRLASPSQGIINIQPTDLDKTFPDGIDLILFDRSNTTPNQVFGPSWFWPALVRYRGILIQVLVASFVVQLFTLANPLLIQVIIDKVIAQRSLDTLQVLGIALVVVTLLEGIISSLKNFLFTETSNRIDQKLGAQVIDHLLRLPLNYFDKRPVGELSSRVGELETIRNFLTGQALTTILDAAFSIIYIIVMLIYSWILTLIALLVLPIQIGITLLGAPLFRRQFRQAAEEDARTQSHLVEVLTGIQTVKSQNVEMITRWKWQEFYAKYISRTFEKTITGTALMQTSQTLQQISQLLVLWVGASLVLAGELTIGQLIAFRIIAGYVTQPLLRLSTIWQSIQELRVSFERLADVIDTPQESNDLDKDKVPLPPVTGEVKFEATYFNFIKGDSYVIKDINLNIKAGTYVGIVGKSGSGKSTMMKLLPRLYSPNKGRIFIDGYDINKVELYSLRRQIGMVPQDPLLFSGSVSENIALTNPDSYSEEIVRAAKIAEAHDFIMSLPSGYSSSVGERGSNLSGGQRQRIAIARTLLTKPKILILDEATSSLDYETERRVCDNLIENMQDKTVFFITHRLSSVRRAELILVMHQGTIEESGTHNELIDRKGRYYALFQQQELD